MTTASPPLPRFDAGHKEIASWTMRRAPAIAHALTLVAAFVALLWVTRRQWFFLDEWAMITHFDASGHTVGAFTPWNEHWSTAVYLYYQAMYHVVGLHSYTPYLVVLFALHVGIVTCLWRLMVRLGADSWVAVGAALLFAFYGAGWENLVWAFQVGYLGPLLLGLAGLLLACRPAPTRWRDALYVIALTAGLSFTEIGIVMLFCGVVAVGLTRGVKTAARLNAVPAGAYLAWYLLVGRAAITVTGSLTAIPVDVVRGLTGSLGAIVGSPVIGGVLLIGLAWFAIRHRRELTGRYAVAAAMALSAVFFGALTALGRGNMETSLVPRYFYVDLLLLTPLIALAATSLIQRLPVRRIAVVTVFVAAAGLGWLTLAHTADAYAPLNTETHQYVVAAAELAAQRPHAILQPPSASIETQFFPFVHVSSLDRLNHDGVLSHDVTPTSGVALAVDLRLETTVTASPAFTRPSTTALAPGTCAHIAPATPVAIALTEPGSLRIVTSDAGADISMVLIDPHGAVSLQDFRIHLRGSSARYVNTTLSSAARFSAVSGQAEICASA